MKTFKILAFDGGGIRGALSVGILTKICEKYPNFLDDVDLFAGTSTGSLIALSLAYNKDINLLNSVYSLESAKYIFSPRRFNLFRPRYSNKRLIEKLNEVFPSNLTLQDLNKYVLIPTFNIAGTNKNGWEALFYNNLPRSEYNQSEKIIDIAVSSCAAPTYFPSHKNCIDGAVIANSASTVSAFYALSHLPTIHTSYNLRILSIGTGDYPDTISSDTRKWGLFQWALNPFIKMGSPILSILLDGPTLITDMYCNEIFRQNYFRINPEVSNCIEMDNYKYIPLLKSIADTTDYTELFNFLENIYLK